PVGGLLAPDERGREAARRAAQRGHRDAGRRPRRALSLVVRFQLRGVELREDRAGGAKRCTVMIRAPSGRSLRHVRILLAAVLVAALLGGCVTPRGKTVYEKPGVTDEEQKKDEAQCVPAGLDTAGARAAAPRAAGRDAADRGRRAAGCR